MSDLRWQTGEPTEDGVYLLRSKRWHRVYDTFRNRFIPVEFTYGLVLIVDEVWHHYTDELLDYDEWVKVE